MAKLSRVFFRLFGSSGPTDDFAEFGSQKAGTPIKTKNPVTIQALAAWLTGWKGATLTDKNLPPLEDMNALFYVLAYMQAYNFQEGIPEWDTDTVYFTGSCVRRPNDVEIYMSAKDDNSGNALPPETSDANWTYAGSLKAGAMVPPGAMFDFAGPSANVPYGYLVCDGSAISRTGTYVALFGAIGTTWGVGDGSTTFNLPDFRRRVAVGAGGAGTGTLGNAVGNVGGEEAHTLTIPEMPVHHHDVTDPTHLHTEKGGQVGGGGGTNVGAVDPGSNAITTSFSNPAATGVTIQDKGGGAAHNNIQPSAVVTKIIKW